jgi:ribosomal protein L39E
MASHMAEDHTLQFDYSSLARRYWRRATAAMASHMAEDHTLQFDYSSLARRYWRRATAAMASHMAEDHTLQFDYSSLARRYNGNRAPAPAREAFQRRCPHGEWGDFCGSPTPVVVKCF